MSHVYDHVLLYNYNNNVYCLQAYAIWFSLATHIIEHYSHKEDDGDDNVDGEPVTPPLPLKKRASKVSRSSGKKKSGKADDDDILEFYSHNELPKQETKYSPRDRRQPIIATRSQLQLELSKCTTPTKDVPVDPKEIPEQPLPQLYMLFKLCVQVCLSLPLLPSFSLSSLSLSLSISLSLSLYLSLSLSLLPLSLSLPPLSLSVSSLSVSPYPFPNSMLYLLQKVNSHYHPDSTVQAINYITILVSKFNVLKCGIKKEVLLEDVRILLKK